MALATGPQGSDEILKSLIDLLSDRLVNSSRLNIVNNRSRSERTGSSSLESVFKDLVDSVKKETEASFRQIDILYKKQLDQIADREKKIETLSNELESGYYDFDETLKKQKQRSLSALKAAQTKAQVPIVAARKSVEQQEVEKLEKLEKQKAVAVDAYERNLWKQASIDKKASIIQQKRDELDADIEVYENRKKLNDDLTDAEEAQLKQLYEDRKKYNEQYFTIQKSLAQEGSRSERYSRYSSEVKRIQEERRAQEALNDTENKNNPTERAIRRREIAANAKTAMNNAAELYGITRMDAKAGGAAETVGNVASVLGSGPSGIMSKLEDILGSSSPIMSAIMSLIKMVGSINSAVSQGIQKAVSAQSTYMGSINARLQVSQNDSTNYYDNMMNTFDTIVGSWTSFVNKTNYVEKLNDLVQNGIAYNAEERALIASLADKMVYTFDALDANLTRLIRIQQRDVTYAALGSEALLTEFLNAQFKDTSYLSNLYDSVSGILLDATAKMTADQASAFSYEVQKWLGSLYSVGLSESGVQQLAQGITYLATGDVSQLTSNSQLQYIYGAAAERGGLSLADMLTSGLDISTTNELLQNVVALLSDVYSTSSTNPVQAAWAGITGMSIADLRSVQNLNNYMASISNSHASWVDSVKETENQLNLVMQTSRTNEATSIENLISNALFSVGENLLQSKYSDTLLNRWLGVNGTSKYLGYYLGSQLGGMAGSVIQSSAIIPAIVQSLEEGIPDVMDNLNQGKNIYQVSGNPLTNVLSYVEKDLTFDYSITSNEERNSFINRVAETLRSKIEEARSMIESGTMSSEEFTRITETLESDVAATQSTIPTLAANTETAVQYAQAYANESSADRELLTEAVDIQDYLFENEQTIRVTLALVEDRAATTLADALNIQTNSEDLHAIRSTIQNKVNVDLIDNDVNSILNNIYTAKWSS